MKKNPATHPFLKGLPADYLKTMQEVSMYAQFEPGEVIFREGALADRFYLIHTGEVELEAEAAGEALASVQTLGPGEVLGWSWLFPPYRWHFHARATRRVTATVYDAVKLRKRCDENAAMGLELMKRISEVLIERLQATRRRMLKIEPVKSRPV